MPSAVQKAQVLFNALAPVTASSSTAQQTFGADHIALEIDFTLGSLTSCDVNLEFAYWSSGLVWDEVFDSQGTQIQLSFTASADGWYFISSPTSNTRMAPVPIATRAWRITLAPTGTATSSSMTMRASPFAMGSVRE